MNSVFGHWLVAGTPPHWVSALAVVAWFALNRILAHSKKVVANTLFEAIFNFLNPFLLRVPVVAYVAQYLDTPPPLPSAPITLFGHLPHVEVASHEANN